MAFYYLMSVGIWLTATLVVRLAGQYVFAPDRPLVIALAFLVTAPAMALLVRRLTLRQRDVARRLRAMVAVAVPAMVRGQFAAWLLWAYCAIFVTGIVETTSRRSTAL